MTDALLHSYADAFHRVIHYLPSNAMREGALAFFIAQGFPNTSQEAWKYTSLARFIDAPFPPGEKVTVAADRLAPFLLPGTDSIVFINGWMVAQPNSALLPLREHAGTWGNAVEALNAAFFTDGVELRISGSLDKPLHFIFLNTPGRHGAYTRHRIILEAGSKAEMVETFACLASPHDLSDRVYFSNTHTTIILHENASLTQYTHQHEASDALHVASAQVTLGKFSHYTHYGLVEGGRLSRRSIEVGMQGEGAACRLNGVYLGKDRQHLDHYTPITHSVPGCFSDQHYKGVLDGQAKGIFYGKVIVPPEAQKTDAHQRNQHLLLSEGAVAYSRPELEIHADDVKCSHGSATGAVDEEALFYLRSRGMSEAEAKTLLVEGFVDEVLEKIGLVSVKERWRERVREWLDFSEVSGG